MITKPTRKCLAPKCKEMAIWGLHFVLLNCEKHKQPGQQNLAEHKCVSCGFMYILDENNRCENCDPTYFIKTRLAKQTALMTFLDAHGHEGVSTDRMVDGGECGKERPDRVFDYGDKIVIVECDEDQHDDRPCLCEQARMVNLGQSFGGMPVYFLRWNPDDYKGGDAPLQQRYEVLASVLSDIKTGRMPVPKALTSALYLYYNGWKGLHKEKWQVLTP